MARRERLHKPRGCTSGMRATALPAIGLCAVALSGSAAETVQSLRYGTSLYHLYQQDYFHALTELMAAQSLDALGPHSAGSELLRGGMALSWGMDREAEKVFQDSLSDTADPATADQAWFYLGKLAWQRGDTPRTLGALGRVTGALEPALEQQATYLRASAELNNGNETMAGEYWQQMSEQSPWYPYLAYNLGAAKAARGDWGAATPYFGEAADAANESEEMLALRDRSLTAAGYAYLGGGEHERSDASFRQVGLEGPYANRALLGYGWSAAGRGDYLAALGPWQVLAGRTAVDASAREGLLAVPYAYERLGRPGTALERYRDASARYAIEIAGIERAIDAFGSEPLGPLLGLQEALDADWLFNADILPRGEHADYLQHLVTRHQFQVALRELRDLYSIAAHLARAEQRADVLAQVDHHQQQVWASLADGDRRAQLFARQQALLEQHRGLQLKLQGAIGQVDGRLLAGPEQVERWTRLERATRTARHLDARADPATRSARGERLRLLRGLLVWEDSEQYPARAWDARRSLRELEQLAQESTRRMAGLDAAIADRREASFAPQIERLAARLRDQSARVASTVALAETRLRQVAIAELERQVEALSLARGRSHLAMAQLYDQGRTEANGE